MEIDSSVQRCPDGPGDYLCPGSSYQCFYVSDMCDGIRHCYDNGYDELNCPEATRRPRPKLEPYRSTTHDVPILMIVVIVTMVLIFIIVILWILWCFRRRNAGRQQARITQEYRQTMPPASYGDANVVVGGYMPTCNVAGNNWPSLQRSHQSDDRGSWYDSLRHGATLNSQSSVPSDPLLTPSQFRQYVPPSAPVQDLPPSYDDVVAPRK